MKESYRKLDPTRMYEITDLTPEHDWTRRIIGAIVQTVYTSTSSAYAELLVIKKSPDGRPHLTKFHTNLIGMSFRPLTLKEQEKLDGS